MLVARRGLVPLASGPREWRQIGIRDLGMTIAIREMGPADISACRLLLSQLGYDLTLQEVKRRYDAIREKQDHAVFVGEQDGRVVALLHLYERPAFDKPPEVIVQALVVIEGPFNMQGACRLRSPSGSGPRWTTRGYLPGSARIPS